MTVTFHIVGAGLAGLACALRLSERGKRVRLYEATNHAGGRCRSFHDNTLDRMVDNGNHVILGANTAALAYLKAIGADQTVWTPSQPIFPFVDLQTGTRWSLRPNKGRIPWWLSAPGRRVPDSTIMQYFAALRLASASSDATVADCLDTRQVIFRRLFEPFTLAILNASPTDAAASLLWKVIKETFGQGGLACAPYIAANGLSASFVDPATDRLRTAGVNLLYGHRLRDLNIAGDIVQSLGFRHRVIPLGAEDRLIVALPHYEVGTLLSGIETPQENRCIVNVHFRLSVGNILPDRTPFLGMIGSTAQWLFLRGDVASVTISDAGALADEPPLSLADKIWSEVTLALKLENAPLPPYRIVKERRATFAQTPAQLRFRSGPSTPIANLFLAGDWTDTGLPATIEGAIRSGWHAADRAMNSLTRATTPRLADMSMNGNASRPAERAA